MTKLIRAFLRLSAENAPKNRYMARRRRRRKEIRKRKEE
jgi:hypothetical protein